MALGAIKGDDERKTGNKEIRELERMGESETVRKRKRRGRFCKEKRERSYEECEGVSSHWRK